MWHNYCYREEIEERLNERENEIENLVQERANLLEEIEKKNVPSIVTADNESQTQEEQDENVQQGNKKLKRVLHKVKSQIDRVVQERPELFGGVSEDPNERLEHLISIVENHTTQISTIEAERKQVEEQLQNEIRQLQRSVTRL